MSLSSSDRENNQPLVISITILAIVGLCISGYLTWVTWGTDSIAGCGGGEIVNCDHVLSSEWSKWLGIPVSLFGLLTYCGILIGILAVALQNSGLGKTLLLAVFAHGCRFGNLVYRAAGL